MATIFIRSHSDSIMDWTNEDMERWLSGIGLSKYAKKFQKSYVTGPVLLQLDEALLDDLYIINSKDRERLLKEARQLTDNYNGSVGDSDNNNMNEEKLEMYRTLSSTERKKNVNKVVCTTEIWLNGRKLSLNSENDDEDEENTFSPLNEEMDDTEGKFRCPFSNYETMKDEEVESEVNYGQSLYEEEKPSDRKHVKFKDKLPDEKLNEKQTKEEWKEENSEADEVISRVTQMVEILSEENSALRKELKNCHTKVAHAQELRMELDAMKASHRDLEVSARKREDLESSMRARLESELRKLQETNKNLRDELECCRCELAAAKRKEQDVETLKQDLKTKNNLVKQLLVHGNESAIAREKLEQSARQQHTRLEDMVAEMQRLNNSLWQSKDTISKLEDKLKQKESYTARMAILQKALEKKGMRGSSQVSTSRWRQSRDLETTISADEGVAELEGPTSVPVLVELIREKDDRIQVLEAETIRLEQNFRQESTSRHLAIKAVSMPKEARIAALEKTAEESERMIAECRSQNLRTIEELYVANRRSADLEAIIKSLHVQLDEKKAKLRSMQNPHEHDEEIPEPEWPSSTTFMHSTFMHTKDLARDVTRDSTEVESLDSGMSANDRNERSMEHGTRKLDEPDEVSVHFWCV